MAVLARTWPGWQIQWAYDGLADIVAYVGLDPETVKAPKTIPIPPDLRTPEKLSAAIPMFQFDPAVFPPGSLLPAELPLVSAPEPMADSDLDEDPECLITIAQDGEVRAYASRSSVGTVIEHGPQVLETCAGWKPARVQGRTPSGGIHLDAGTRSAGVWTGGVLYQALADAPRLWPGWHWERWGDRYGEQLARCAGTVIFPAPDLCAGLERLREQFDRHQDSDTATSSIALLLGVLGAIKGAADSVGLATHTIEDHSFDHRPVDLPEEERAMVMGVIGEILPECQT